MKKKTNSVMELVLLCQNVWVLAEILNAESGIPPYNFNYILICEQIEIWRGNLGKAIASHSEFATALIIM